MNHQPCCPDASYDPPVRFYLPGREHAMDPQGLCYVIPPKYFIIIIKSIMLKGNSFLYIWKETLVLAGNDPIVHHDQYQEVQDQAGINYENGLLHHTKRIYPGLPHRMMVPIIFVVPLVSC